MGSSTHHTQVIAGGAASRTQWAALVQNLGADNLMLIGLMITVLFCHTATSFFEEQLFKKLKFEQPFFMVWIMSILYSLLYLIITQFRRDSKLKCHPLVSLAQASDSSTVRNLLFICLLCTVSNCSSKLALEYVSIPTQIVFKSCKLVAVMLGSYIVLGNTYSLFEYAVASSLVGGMCLFTLGDMHGTSMSSISAADWHMMTGIVILCGALLCDSLLGNLQEKVQKSKACSETELMFVQSAFGSVFLLIIMTFSGELSSAIREADNAVLLALIPWALCNMAGITCLLRIVGKFSAVTAVLTSFVRKLSSISISYIYFPKPLTIMHLFGILLVFGAIGAHSVRKHAAQQRRKEHELEAHPLTAAGLPGDDKV